MISRTDAWRFSNTVDWCSAAMIRADRTAALPRGCLPREMVANSWRAADIQAADGATVIAGALRAGVVRPRDGGAATLTDEGCRKNVENLVERRIGAAQ